MENEIEPDDGIIVLKGLTKRFGEILVLNDISLAFEKGKTTVIIGPSGCGKTVLIKHIIVLLRPGVGEVYFHDQRIDDLPENKLENPDSYGIFVSGRGAFRQYDSF